MSPGDLADTIIRALASGRFRITFHASERLSERGASRADLMSVGHTARTSEYQPENDTYLVKGLDLDGDDLSVVCGYDGETVVVTLF